MQHSSASLRRSTRLSNQTIRRSSKVRESSVPRQTRSTESSSENSAPETSRFWKVRVASKTKSTKSLSGSTPQIRHSKTSGGKPFSTTVTFKTVLEFFHVSSFENALSLDDIIFLYSIWKKLTGFPNSRSGVSYRYENGSQERRTDTIRQRPAPRNERVERGTETPRSRVSSGKRAQAKARPET